MWLLELANAAFTVEAEAVSFVIGQGSVGIDDREKLAIGLFKHADERDPRVIHEIPTLNLATRVAVDIADDLDDRRLGVANSIVEPYIRPAFIALLRLIEAYRDVKYRQSRGTPEWLEQRGVFVREMPFTTFNSYLFYRLRAGSRTFVGVFSKGHVVSSSPGDARLRDAVTATLARRVPVARVLMVRAWEDFFEGDFRSAIVNAATVIEHSLAAVLRGKMLAAKAASKGRIDDFIKDTSNRQLVTVVGGLLRIESEEWREGVAASLDVRHALVHGGQRRASEADARSAIAHAERLLILAEEPSGGTADPGTGGGAIPRP